MAFPFNDLKSDITNYVKANGTGAITGDGLQSQLLSMIDSLGYYSGFGGIATTSTNPGTPDGRVFYLAAGAGAYSNFGITISDESIHTFTWNGSSWTDRELYSLTDLIADTNLSDLQDVPAYEEGKTLRIVGGEPTWQDPLADEGIEDLQNVTSLQAGKLLKVSPTGDSIIMADPGNAGNVQWGGLLGDINSQTDLIELNEKVISPNGTVQAQATDSGFSTISGTGTKEIRGRIQYTSGNDSVEMINTVSIGSSDPYGMAALIHVNSQAGSSIGEIAATYLVECSRRDGSFIVNKVRCLSYTSTNALNVEVSNVVYKAGGYLAIRISRDPSKLVDLEIDAKIINLSRGFGNASAFNSYSFGPEFVYSGMFTAKKQTYTENLISVQVNSAGAIVESKGGDVTTSLFDSDPFYYYEIYTDKEPISVTVTPKYDATYATAVGSPYVYDTTFNVASGKWLTEVVLRDTSGNDYVRGSFTAQLHLKD